MKMDNLLIVLMLFVALLLTSCDARDATESVVTEGAQAGDLTGLKDCEFRPKGSRQNTPPNAAR